MTIFSIASWGRERERGKKGFVYFRLPLRMFLLQSIDNQNVLGGRGETKLELICPKCSVEVPCCLVYVPKRTHAVFKSNISSDKDYIRTSVVFFFSCEYLRIGGHLSVQLHRRLSSCQEDWANPLSGSSI